MPLELVLNDLLTDAVKHGLHGHDRGTIRVTFKSQCTPHWRSRTVVPVSSLSRFHGDS